MFIIQQIAFITVYIIALISYFLKRNLIQYEILCYAIYLLHLIIYLQIDYPIVIYTIFAFLPLLKHIRIRANYYSIFLIYVIISVGISLFMNDYFMVLSIFFSRYAFLFIFSIFMCSSKSLDNVLFNHKAFEKSLYHIVQFLFILELALTIFLSIYGDEGGLTLNHQPLGGSILLGISPIIVALIPLANKKYNNHIKPIIILLFLFTVLSGTRGYILVTAGVVTYLVYEYVFILSNKQEVVGKLILVISAILAVFFIVFLSGVLNSILNTLGVYDSTGWRSIENGFAIEIMKHSTWTNVIFGYGIGGNALDNPYFYQVAISVAGQDYYMIDRFIRVAAFLNYWLSITYNLGILGSAIIISLFYNIFRSIKKCKSFKKVGLYVYLILYIILLAYRMSVSCAIFEFIMLAIAIRYLQYKDYNCKQQ